MLKNKEQTESFSIKTQKEINKFFNKKEEELLDNISFELLKEYKSNKEGKDNV